MCRDERFQQISVQRNINEVDIQNSLHSKKFTLKSLLGNVVAISLCRDGTCEKSPHINIYVHTGSNRSSNFSVHTV